MSDITLVNTVFPSEVKVPPQGLLYLTAALDRAGFDVDIRDYQLCEDEAPWEPEALARFVADSAPVIGFSAMSYALPLIIAAVRQVKARDPDKIIVLGGIGPSGVAAPLIEFCNEIDIVVDGEGERTIVDLMRALHDGRDLGSVPGIIRRVGTRAVVNARRPRIASMTELDPPAYQRIDLARYRLVDSQFGRGCPFKCTFCDIAPYWDRLNTHRPISHFVDELDRLVRVHGARDVFIVDDTFVLSRKAIMQFCDDLIGRALPFEWGCYARVDLMDEELMARMAAAGCRKIFYGVESGADGVLDAIVKETNVETITRIIAASLRHFPFVTASFVWGFPDETLDDLQQTVMLLLYLTSLGASPQLNLVLPYSYSTLYHQYRDRIAFDPRYSSQLQFYESKNKEWLHDMIAARPDLFSAFYQLPTKDFAEKWSYLEQVGLSPHELQRAYDHPLGPPVAARTSAIAVAAQ